MNNTYLMNDKLMPAKLPNIHVERAALLRTFERAAEKPIVVLTAAAGCGKSTSTILWLEHSARKHAWINLDVYDNSLSVFYRLFCAAVISLQPDNLMMQDIYRSPSFNSSPVEHTVRLLTEFQPDGLPKALVLDNLHYIDLPEIKKSLPLVLKRFPKPFVTLLLSRTRANDEYLDGFDVDDIAVIDAKQLAFSSHDIHDYLEAYKRVSNKAQTDRILSLTGGWPMGVLAIAQSGQTDFQGDYGHLLSKYISTQIWDKWDETLKDFLMKVSILNTIDVESAVTVTGYSDSKKMLKTACQTCPFISQVGESGYRFHDLFVEFLRTQAKDCNLHTADLHQIAAEFYLAKGDVNTARYHAMQTNDIAIIIETTTAVQNNTSSSLDEYTSFYSIFNNNALSKEICDAYPFLYSSLIGQCCLVGDAKGVAKYIGQLAPLLPELKVNFPQFTQNALGLLMLDPRHTILELMTSFKEEWKTSKTSTSKYKTGHYSTSMELPLIHRASNNFHELLDESYLPLLKDTLGNLMPGHIDFMTDYLYAGLLMERGRPQKAKEYIANNVLEMTKKEKPFEGLAPEFVFSTLCTEIAIEVSLNQYAIAGELLSRLGMYIKQSGAEYLSHNLTAIQTKLKMWMGDRQASADWLAQYYVSDSYSLKLYKIYQHFITLRAYIVTGQFEEAISFADKLINLADDFNRLIDASEARVLLSIALWAMNRKDDAAKTLEYTLNEMQPYGLIRIIADEGNSILPLLKYLTTKVSKSDYNGSLTPTHLKMLTIAAHGYAKQRKGLYLGSRSKPVKLSKSQKDVLELFAKGYSRSEVAEALNISIDTVKTHASIAYRKLDVHSAIDAVLKAQQLGLI